MRSSAGSLPPHNMLQTKPASSSEVCSEHPAQAQPTRTNLLSRATACVRVLVCVFVFPSLLGSLLDDVLKSEVGAELFNKVERIRSLAQCAAQLANKHDSVRADGEVVSQLHTHPPDSDLLAA